MAFGIVLTPVRKGDFGCVEPSGFSAEEAEWLLARLRLLTEHDHLGISAQQRPSRPDAQPAAPAPGAGGVRFELEVVKAVRGLDLVHLRVLCGHGASGHDRAEVGVAVEALGRARAPLHREKKEVHEAAVASIVESARHSPVAFVPARRDAVGDGLGERLHGRLPYLMGKVVAVAGGAGKLRVQHRIFRENHFERPQDSRVVRNLGVNVHEDGDHQPARRGVKGGVRVAGGRARRAGVVERNFIALYRDRADDRVADAFLVSVVREKRLALVLAVGHGGDLRAHDPLGAVHDVNHVAVENLPAVAVQYIENAPLAQIA